MILGTGIDIIEIERVQKAIERWGEAFLNHVFNDEEIQYARQHKSPYQHYAARFAAKEAVYKAIGHDPRLGWKDMTIVNDAHGQPCCVFANQEFKHKVFLSISHSKHYAVANAIITS